MLIPKEVVGNKKVRDAKLLTLYLNGEGTYEELATRFGISVTRVGQIIYRNRHLVQLDRQHEQGQRVAHLKRLIKRNQYYMGNKDVVDLIKEMRIEVEGGKGESSSGGGSTKVIIIREGRDADKDQERSVPRQISLLKV